jgi:hypothetical protein
LSKAGSKEEEDL